MDDIRIYYYHGKYYWEDKDSGHGPFDSLRDAAFDVMIEAESQEIDEEYYRVNTRRLP